jgi:hypothetical protein
VKAAAVVVAAVSVVATATDRSASLQIKRLPRELTPLSWTVEEAD